MKSRCCNRRSTPLRNISSGCRLMLSLYLRHLAVNYSGKLGKYVAVAVVEIDVAKVEVKSYSRWLERSRVQLDMQVWAHKPWSASSLPYINLVHTKPTWSRLLSCRFKLEYGDHNPSSGGDKKVVLAIAFPRRSRILQCNFSPFSKPKTETLLPAQDRLGDLRALLGHLPVPVRFCPAALLPKSSGRWNRRTCSDPADRSGPA